MKYCLLLPAALLVPIVGFAQRIEESSVVNASLSDFANLHPLVVHLPIMLLMIAACTQLASIFIWKKPLNWVTLLLLVGGVAGAIASSKLTHPHTHGLTPAAQQVLALHDTYADWTLWLSVAGLTLKSVSMWLVKDRRWLEVAIAVVVSGSAVTVGMTGHYGGTLVYIHGVGVQGNFLESESGNSHKGHHH